MNLTEFYAIEENVALLLEFCMLCPRGDSMLMWLIADSYDCISPPFIQGVAVHQEADVQMCANLEPNTTMDQT